ncbi:MAG: paraquat-inducible protein A [Pseudomonadota bacterium]
MRAIDQGIARCMACGSLTDRPGEPCAYCGGPTALRKRNSLQRVWAFWLAGVIAYIPGNLYPIMVTESLAGTSASTIMGGVISLIHHHSYSVAFVVFFASVLVPVTKFAIIAWLALTIQFDWPADEHRRVEAHEVIEFIGRWSMIDVFVVAALAALIQVGGLMTISPGIGINAFALSVMFTMLSAMSFDSRRIWDTR